MTSDDSEVFKSELARGALNSRVFGSFQRFLFHFGNTMEAADNDHGRTNMEAVEGEEEDRRVEEMEGNDETRRDGPRGEGR